MFLSIFDLHSSIVLAFSIPAYPVCYFSAKLYVVGTQKSCLNEMVLLSTQNNAKNYG